MQDFYHKTFGIPASADILTHLKRELMHGVWGLLLDSNFMGAYESGIVLTCADGVQRLVFPRFFVYSADYPEKYFILIFMSVCLYLWISRVLLATVKPRSKHMCPRCLVTTKHLCKLGTIMDMKRRERDARVDSTARQDSVHLARRRMFKYGDPIKSRKVQSKLDEESLVPTHVSMLLFPW